MAFRKPAVLLAALSALLLGHAGTRAQAPKPPDKIEPAPVAARPLPPLPGASTVSNVRVSQRDGRWFVSAEAFFTGEPVYTRLYILQAFRPTHAPGQPHQRLVTKTLRAERGTHSYTAELGNPGFGETPFTTEEVEVGLESLPPHPHFDRQLLASMTVKQQIRWPVPMVDRVERAIAAGTEDAIVREAAGLIDTEQHDSLQRARTLLQLLVERKPQVDAAYVELARAAMMLSQNQAGVREAETLLNTALQIRPDSVDAKILLGHVYTHQKRFPQAEALLADAARKNPPNLWVWVNWGDALALQGKKVPAVAKYREAVSRPPTGDTYDRARKEAYRSLLPLLAERKDLDGQQALLAQRSREYPDVGCFTVAHARFLVLDRVDAAAGLAVLREGPMPQCDENDPREVQGLAHYILWARPSGRPEALFQARAFLPAGPRLFYVLAARERTSAVAGKLVAAGDAIDVRDEDEYNALSYALRAEQPDAARRLLHLGAKPDALVGAEQMPVAMIPVLSRDAESIRLMQRAGIDYTTLRFQGYTAIDHARSRNDIELLQWLDARSGKL